MSSLRTISALVLSGSCLTAGPCTKPPAEYQGYRVGRVTAGSPVAFFSAARAGLDRIAGSLPLRSGSTFDLERYNQGPARIAAEYRARFEGSHALLIVAAAGTIENCDDETKTVDVRYVVYSAFVPETSARLFAVRQEASERPATTGGALGAQGRLLAQPLLGYDESLGGYGGIQLRSGALKLDSMIAGKGLDGTIGWTQGPWHLTADFRDLPAGNVKLIRSTLSAGYFGSLKAFQYGASLEGGNTGIAMKFLAGLTGRLGPGDWTATYGIEIGNPLSGRSPDFAKHIVDLAYAGSFTRLPQTQSEQVASIGRPHHPLTLEARLGGGVIQSAGAVPAAESFFGGDRNVPFLPGSPWDVRGQAFIRSIPGDALGGPGGTRFYALNLTLAKAVYGRPLMPRELGTDDFLGNLNFAINTARGELSDTLLAKDPVLREADAAISTIQELLDGLKEEIAALPAATLPPSLVPDLGRAARTAAAAHNGSAVANALVTNVLPKLESDLAKVESGLTAADAAPLARRLAGLRERLSAARKAAARSVSGPAFDAARKRSDQSAAREFSEVDRILDTILYELNICSIAPVAIFDAARIWPSRDGVQYAAGAGLRFSVVNVNVTFGYAANPRPGWGLPKGAVFLQFDAANLFH